MRKSDLDRCKKLLLEKRRVMMDEMGIETNLDVDKVLETGIMVERIVGRRLRSEAIKNGRIPKDLKADPVKEIAKAN